MERLACGMLRCVWMLCLTASVFSCSKEVFEENETEADVSAMTGNSQLRVRAQRAANGESITYPIQVYIFNSEDQCINSQTIASDGESVNLLKAKAGSYTVVAVGGSDDNYELPEQEDATLTTLLALKDGQGHDDLMVAKSTVTLGENESNTVTLAMVRKVFQLQGVTISNVPAAVTAVEVQLSPLREGVLLNGEYTGTAGTHTVTLAREGSTTTWKNTTACYLLPSVGNASVTVKMTRDGVVKSYTYTAAEALGANYKLKIEGSYGGDDFQLSGTITGATWAGEKSISFNFDESGSSAADPSDNNDPGDDSNDDDVINAAAPTLGSVYDGALVVKSTANGDGSTTVLLLAPSKTNTEVNTTDDAEAVKTKITTALASISVGELSGWRLPTMAELVYLNSIKSDLDEYTNRTSVNSFINSRYYFYQKDADTIELYCPSTEDEIAISAMSYSNTVLRTVTTLKFKATN